MVNYLPSKQRIRVRFPLPAVITQFIYYKLIKPSLFFDPSIRKVNHSARLVKLVNTTDLKSVPFWVIGSSPIMGTGITSRL